MLKKLLFAVFMLICSTSQAQNATALKWFNPISSTYPVLKGKYWQNADSANFYTRLPAAAEQSLAQFTWVWPMAKHTAGTYIDFFTNAPTIQVRYQIEKYVNYDNMTKISTNGLDMYAQDVAGTWHWTNDEHKFNDTITFTYGNMDPSIKIKRFRLYLPLHTSPKWLEIGVPKNTEFKAEPATTKNCIVFYGTSIMHGGAASRHGLAWLSILGRRFTQPLINLGLSGTGRLDKPVIDLINTIDDAQLYVLDCQPNLLGMPADELAKRITLAVETLHQKHPKTPVLLVEHSGALPDVSLNIWLTKRHQQTTAVLDDTYAKLKKQIPNLYLLTAKEIGFNLESTADGTHPNDLGMMQYANAYEKVIRSILAAKK